jgi:glycosyltransferase involved in cell wall biosynthesis
VTEPIPRICFLNSNPDWGGGEKWHLDYAQALWKEGFQVWILGRKNGKLLEKANDVHIPTFPVTLGKLSFLNPFALLALYLLFLRIRPTHLILNLPADLKAGSIAARWAGIPSVFYRRGSAIPVKNSLINRLIFSRFLTGIIANSQATRECLLANNGQLFPAEKIHVIYNGIERIPDFDPLPAPTPNTIPVIGNLGRMVHQKGQEFLIELGLRLKRKEIPFSMVIGGSGPLLSEMKMKCKQLGLEDLIRFPGFIADPKAFLGTIDLFVLPSRWEGFGYVIAEAMRAGKPVVAWNISSNPELIAEGKNGFLIPPFDIEALAEKVAFLLLQPGERKRLGQEGKAFVERELSFENSLTRLKAALQLTTQTP